MKQTCILSLLFAFLSITLCQSQSISYQYDEAGNRVLRKVVVLGGQQSIKQHPKADSTAVIDKSSNQEVKIYPNPTRGRLLIDLSTFPENKEILLALYTGKGELLISSSIWSGNTELDLSAYSRGWYVLRISTVDFKREYKIIKE